MSEELKPIGYARKQDLLEYKPVVVMYDKPIAPENGTEAVALYSEDQLQHELDALRTRLEEAQQEAALHKTRCAAILFSGAIHLNTGGEVQGWEREYVNQRTRADEAERKLAEAYRVRRFNIRESGDELFICKDNHEKYEPCVEQHYVPVERLIVARAEGMEEAAKVCDEIERIKHGIMLQQSPGSASAKHFSNAANVARYCGTAIRKKAGS